MYFIHLFLAITFDRLVAQRTALNWLNLGGGIFCCFDSHTVPLVVLEIQQFRFSGWEIMWFYSKYRDFKPFSALVSDRFWPIFDMWYSKFHSDWSKNMLKRQFIHQKYRFRPLCDCKIKCMKYKWTHCSNVSYASAYLWVGNCLDRLEWSFQRGW